MADTGAAAIRPSLLVSAPIAGRVPFYGPADTVQLNSVTQSLSNFVYMIFHPTPRPGMMPLAVSEAWVCFKLHLSEERFSRHARYLYYILPRVVRLQL